MADPIRRMARVAINVNNVIFQCDTDNDDLYFAWLTDTLRTILTGGLSPATLLKFVYVDGASTFPRTMG